MSMKEEEKEKEETKVSSLKTNEQALQTVVTCVANLSLVSCAHDVRTIRPDVNYPVIKSVSIPKTGVKMVATAAADGARPVLTKPGPQSASVVKKNACQRVDVRKKTLPVLQQPVNKVTSDTRDSLSAPATRPKVAISRTVAEVKNADTGVPDVASEAAQGSEAATKNTVTGSTVGQKGASNTCSSLWKTASWLDPFLPVAGRQLAWLTASRRGLPAVSAGQPGEQSIHSVHLGLLPSKLRQRFVGKMKDTIQSVQDGLFHLQITFDLIEYSKRSVDQKRPDVEEELNKMWLAWSMAELEMGERETLLSEPMESQILRVLRNIIQRLRTACLALRFNTQGFPGHMREKIQQLETLVEHLQTYTYAAASFQNFPDTMLELCKLKILKARMLLHDMLDFVIENITLTWFGEPLASFACLTEGAKGTEATNQPLGRRSK